MADIKQAAKWMQEKRGVRRPYFARDAFLFDEQGQVFYRSIFYESDWAQLGTNDLLAEDWELAD